MRAITPVRQTGRIPQTEILHSTYDRGSELEMNKKMPGR